VPFLLAQRTLPGMQERRFGRILFISSVAAFTGGLIGPHYAASRRACTGSPISWPPVPHRSVSPSTPWPPR
jgi:NAD(P)-dependent dehydrogenase (short-subunit alcohol dehydrogenase family)